MSWVDIGEVWGLNDHDASCCYRACWFYIGIEVDDDCGNDGFLLNDFIEENLFNTISFAWALLHPLFPRRTSVISLCWGALAFCDQTGSLFSDLTCGAKQCTVVSIFEPQFECIVCWMDSGSPSKKFLEYNLIIYSVPSKPLIQLTFGVFLGQVAWRLCEAHQVGVTSAITSFVAYIFSQ